MADPIFIAFFVGMGSQHNLVARLLYESYMGGENRGETKPNKSDIRCSRCRYCVKFSLHTLYSEYVPGKVSVWKPDVGCNINVVWMAGIGPGHTLGARKLQ